MDYLTENFLLNSKTAEILYHDYAAKLPIIDFHNHLCPQSIASNKQYATISELWLKHDHYKWRAMRANGIDEHFITGNASDYEKFEKWAQTMPYLLRNPLYDWTHLELKNYFNIDTPLNANTAKSIYDECNKKLALPEFSVLSLLEKSKVEVLCTTDDPLDTLSFHKEIATNNKTKIKVLPTWRPDNVWKFDDLDAFKTYCLKLSEITNTAIDSIQDYLRAIKLRHDYFATMGCKVADYGMPTFFSASYNQSEINNAFDKLLKSQNISLEEDEKLKSFLLVELCKLNYEKGWVQQFHVGVLRNNNHRMFKQLGGDAGFDSIGDFNIAKPMEQFFNRLNDENALAKSIIYNLNPRDNDLIACMIANFNESFKISKMQYGSAWWFLDNKKGIKNQIDTISNYGLLSRFVGMLTDSRSFLSFSRHEYFRRILCNIIGNEVENGELPNDMTLLSETIENICYYNAKEYFSF